jgi:hypothetical protein
VNCPHGRPGGAFCPHCTGNTGALIPALPPVITGMKWAPPPVVITPVFTPTQPAIMFGGA